MIDALINLIDHGSDGVGSLTNRSRSPARFEHWLLVHRVPPLNFWASVASITSLVLVLVNFLGWRAEFIPIVYLCGLSAYLIVRYLRHLRWAAYAECLTVYERALRQLQRATELFERQRAAGVAVTRDTDDPFVTALGESLTSLAEAFTLVAQMPCRVAIAEPVALVVADPAGTQPDEALDVQVLVRSSDGKPHDDSRQPLSGNSDFLHVVRTHTVFFSDDLIKSYKKRSYENTKWTPELVDAGRVDYQSAIVWPVESAVLATSAQARRPPVAFLCVDAPRRDAFVAATDIPLGAGYAHALFALVHPWLSRSKGP